MSDSHIAITVLLDRTMKTEAVERLMAAIRLLQGVMDVVPVVTDVQTLWAKEIARRELVDQLYKVLEPELSASAAYTGLPKMRNAMP